MRLWAANEALSFGRGGVRAVAEALAISAKTIMQGKRELQGPSPHPDSVVVGGRQRRPGGGRKSILEKHPQLLAAVEQIVDPAIRGDPMKPLRWVSKSLSHIVDELSRQGYRVSMHTVSKILQEDLEYGMPGFAQDPGRRFASGWGCAVPTHQSTVSGISTAGPAGDFCR